MLEELRIPTIDGVMRSTLEQARPFLGKELALLVVALLHKNNSSASIRWGARAGNIVLNSTGRDLVDLGKVIQDEKTGLFWQILRATRSGKIPEQLQGRLIPGSYADRPFFYVTDLTSKPLPQFVHLYNQPNSAQSAFYAPIFYELPGPKKVVGVFAVDSVGNDTFGEKDVTDVLAALARFFGVTATVLHLAFYDNLLGQTGVFSQAFLRWYLEDHFSWEE
jgi:hypothetical protein